jgi:hypothetical protein
MAKLVENVRVPEPFAVDARRALHGLRGALRHVIDRVPSGPIVRASQLASALDLDTRLAWKIWKVIELQDPFAASQLVPGRAGIRIFLRAANRHGVGADVLKTVDAAFEELQRVIKSHAGDRRSFNAMLAGHAVGNERRADLEHRKSAFHHLSFLWGVQARTHLNSFIVRASEDRQGYTDVVTLRGFIDLRWIRPQVSWRVRRMSTTDDLGNVRTDFERQPLSPAPEGDRAGADAPLLREFCSVPPPRLREPDSSSANLWYELVEGSVGNSGLLTCLFGEIGRGVEPYVRSEDYPRLVFAAYPRTPAETLIFDLIIHRDMLGRLNPTAHMYGDLFNQGFNRPPSEADRLPLAENVKFLGSGANAVHAAEVPQYPEMARFALDRVDWPESEFDVYRLRIPYPMIPTRLWIAQDLPA